MKKIEVLKIFRALFWGKVRPFIRVAFANYILRYIFSGGTAASVNLLVLYCLVDFLNLHYLVASAIAYFVGFVLSFSLHKFVTFLDFKIDRVMMQVIRYLPIFLINIALNLFFMWSLVDSLGLNYLISQVSTFIILAIFSFLLYRRLVFPSESRKTP